MLTSSPIPRQTVGRTFFISLIVLGVVALVELGAVGVAFIKRVRSNPKESHITMRGAEGPKEPGQLNMADTFAPVETAPPAGMPKPTPIDQKAFAPALSPTQGRQNELAEQAKALRDRGDMSTALTRLREAQALGADNPYILSEMALTYEKMGLPDKALDIWQRIYNMGETAGTYYALAKTKLNPVGVAPEGSKDTEGFQPGSTLALTDITRTDFDDDPAVSKLKLKIPVKARPGSKIDVHDVVIQVFFYDQINDENASIVRTNADVTSTWTTAPVDWNNSDIEVLEVEYKGVPPDPKEKHPEKRTFFGYIVRIYYKGALQDMRADPVKLLKQYPPPLTLSSEDTE